MEAALPLSNRIRFGAGIAAGNREAAIEAINSLAAWGYDIIWMPDHVAFTGPVSDPFAQLTQIPIFDALDDQRAQDLLWRQPVAPSVRILQATLQIASYAVNYRRIVVKEVRNGL